MRFFSLEGVDSTFVCCLHPSLFTSMVGGRGKAKKVIFWHSTRFTGGKFFSTFSSHFLRYSSSLAILGMLMFFKERKYLLVTKQHLLLQERMTLLLLRFQFFYYFYFPSTSLMWYCCPINEFPLNSFSNYVSDFVSSFLVYPDVVINFTPLFFSNGFWEFFFILVFSIMDERIWRRKFFWQIRGTDA